MSLSEVHFGPFYWWIRSDGTTDTEITGARYDSYTLTDDDLGKTVKVRMNVRAYTDDSYDEFVSRTSEPTAAVVLAPYNTRVNTPATGVPTISGTLRVGQTLTADVSGIADADGMTNVSYSYRWITNDGTGDTEVGAAGAVGATTATITLPKWARGRTFKVRVSFIDDGGSREILTSSATGVVAPLANNPPTGRPTINGSAWVGETLTADASSIRDADGLRTVYFNDEPIDPPYDYQWLRSDGSADADIAGATGDTYTLAAADVGHTVKVRVSFTDAAGYEETLTSAATNVVAPEPNIPATGAPTISGTAQVGETLTADTSGIADADHLTNPTYSYQWLSGHDTEIEGATGSNYTLQDADAGKTIKVRVTFTDDAGHEETLTSAPTAAVAASPDSGPAVTLELSPSGSVDEGTEITVTMSFANLESDSDTSDTDYIFRADVKDADGCEGGGMGVDRYMYKVDEDPEVRAGTISASCGPGDYTVDVSISSPGNVELASATADFTVNAPATGAPTISGTAQVGETLTASTSGIADADGLSGATFSYQWVSNDGTTDSDIQGATDSTYTLVPADAGKTIKVRVTFTDDAGNEETLTSAATAAVATAMPGDTPSANLRAGWSYSPWPQTEGRPISVQVSLNWDTPDGYGITNYVAQMYKPNGDEFGLPLTGATIVGETQRLGSGELWIQPDTAYEYVLTLRNAANETIVEGDVTVIVHSTAENPATEAPTNLKALLASDGSSVVLSWDAPEGNLWRYEVIRDWRLNGSVAATQNYVVNKKYTTYTDTNIGALSGRTYEYRVRAVTGFYTSYDSEVVSIQILSPSSDATLSSLTLSGIAFGTFESGTYSYSAQVGNSVSQTTVTPTTNDDGATYVVKLDGVADDDGVIPLSVGSNTITIEVTAEDGNATQTYTVTVTRAEPPAPGPAVAVELSPSGSVDEGTEIALTMSFANLESDTDTSDTDYIFRADVVNADGCEGGGMGLDRYMYKVDEDPEVRGGVISASCASGDYTVQVSISSPGNVELASATADFTVAAPAEQQQAQEPAPSTDATLSSLALSDVTLAFASSTTEYTASVANDVDETTVTLTTNDDGATYEIKLGGVADDDGIIPLAVGSNVITIEVTAEDGNTVNTYTVTVTRVAPTLSTDATLKGLALSDVDFGAFDPDATDYTADVANDVAETTVTPAVNHDGAAYVVKLDGVEDDGTAELAVGENVITIEVTAEDGETTQTYTVTVTRAEPPLSDDATLRGLALSGVTLAFDPATTSYAAEVGNDVAETTVSPTVNDDGAAYAVQLNGVADADGTVELAVGANPISVEVTAEDGQTTKTYTVTVTRAEPLSTDATLSNLTLSDVNFGAFDSATTGYTAEVANNVAETTVSPTVNDDGATYAIKLDGVVDDDGVIPLAVGENEIGVVVTAEDGETTRTYTVSVTRAEAQPEATATVELSPSGPVTEGAEIIVTMTFTGLALDSEANLVFRADVVGADACEGEGIGVDRNMSKVDEDPETRKGTISAACPAGDYTLTVSIWSPDAGELASASAGFTVVEPEPGVPRLSRSQRQPTRPTRRTNPPGR